MKQTSLLGIAKKAASDKAHRFQNLIGMLTVGYLLACWRLINKRAAYGVDRQVILIRRSKTAAGMRSVPMSETARAILLAAVAERGVRGAYIFATATEGAAPFGNFGKTLPAFLYEAGVSRRITIHDLRRFAYTRMAALGIDDRVIRILVGHQWGSAMTQTYNQHRYLEDARDATEKLEASILADVFADG